MARCCTTRPRISRWAGCNVSRHRRGLTIIELLVAGLIAVVVGSGVLALATASWQSHDAILAQNQVQREARAGLDMVCHYVRNLWPWTGTHGINQATDG